MAACVSGTRQGVAGDGTCVAPYIDAFVSGVDFWAGLLASWVWEFGVVGFGIVFCATHGWTRLLLCSIHEGCRGCGLVPLCLILCFLYVTKTGDAEGGRSLSSVAYLALFSLLTGFFAFHRLHRDTLDWRGRSSRMGFGGLFHFRVEFGWVGGLIAGGAVIELDQWNGLGFVTWHLELSNLFLVALTTHDCGELLTVVSCIPLCRKIWMPLRQCSCGHLNQTKRGS